MRPEHHLGQGADLQEAGLPSNSGSVLADDDHEPLVEEEQAHREATLKMKLIVSGG